MAKIKSIAPIEWASKKVKVVDIEPTPNNYKIKTDLGKQRFQQSLKKFGLAGNAVVNPKMKNGKHTGKYVLIDGNSRVEDAKEKGTKEIWVSIPNVPLTDKQFIEMSAMFDFAVAGDVDTERIKKDLGTTADFYNAWGWEVPMELLSGMGKAPKNAVASQNLEYPGEKKGKTIAGQEVTDIKMVQLFFSQKQEEEFRKWEEKFGKKHKVEGTTNIVLKAIKLLKV